MGYGVSPLDVSGLRFDEFLTELAVASDEQIDSEVRAMCEHGRVATFLEKVRRSAPQLGIDPSAKLALSLSRSGDLFPTSGGTFSSFKEDAALRILWLLRNIPAEDRGEVALQGVKNAQPLLFSLEIARWMQSGEDQSHELTKEEQDALLKAWVQRLEAVLSGGRPVYEEFPRDAGTVLYIWAEVSGRAVTEKYLQPLLARGQGEVLGFLNSMLSNATSLMTGKAVYKPFSTDNYNAVAMVIDPNFVAEKLRQFGFEPRLLPERPTDEVERMVQTAQRFLALHERAQVNGKSS